MSHRVLTGTFDNDNQPTGNKMVDCTCATPHRVLTGTFDNNDRPTGNKMVDCTCATPHCQLQAGNKHVPMFATQTDGQGIIK